MKVTSPGGRVTGVRAETPTGEQTIEADICLLAIGVTGNVENLFGKDAPVELFKSAAMRSSETTRIVTVKLTVNSPPSTPVVSEEENPS